MSKYNLVDIFEGFKDSLSQEEKESFDRLSSDEQDKLEKIKKMMDVEKSGIKEADAVDLAIEASQKKAGIKEEEEVEEVTSSEGSRIEGLLDRELKRKFIFAFEDLYTNLIEEDIFDPSDVIEHLGIELEKHIDSLQDAGDRLAGMEEGYGNEDGDLDDSPTEEETEKMRFKEAEYKVSMKDVVLALIKDAKGTNPEIDLYVKSLKQSGDEFDDVDDYVEDFKNYIADKSLQEHFGRFMKDYQ